MPRFEIVLSRARNPQGGAPGERRFVLGRVASLLVSALTALIAVAVVALALVLGYLVAAAIIAAVIVALLVALLRGAFVALRR